jgi:multiple sugar transport system substrate-binding protein
MITVILLGLTAGCNRMAGVDSAQLNASAEANRIPVKLLVYQRSANISDDEFRIMIAEPVKKKYPHISLELLHSDKDNTPETHITRGIIPDLVFTNAAGVRSFKDLNMVEDLSGYVKKNQYDLSRIEPDVIETIKTLGDPNQLHAIPFSINFSALFYNKDIFDKFGVPYPRDGMTWDEVTQLAKQVTRVDNGQQIYGFHPEGIDRMAGQLILSPFDAGTKKATLTGDGWQRIFQTYKAVFDIPGNNPANGTAIFLKDRNLAMIAAMGARLGELEDLYNQGNPMNWDLVSFPVFPEASKTAAELAIHMLMMTSNGQHKEEAFKVLEVVTEADNQSEMNKRGRLTALKDPEIKENFASNLKSTNGKNIKGIFTNAPAVSRFNDKYSDLAKTQLAPAMSKVLKGEADINTALRGAEEAANIMIAAELKNK